LYFSFLVRLFSSNRKNMVKQGGQGMSKDKQTTHKDELLEIIRICQCDTMEDFIGDIKPKKGMQFFRDKALTAITELFDKREKDLRQRIDELEAENARLNLKQVGKSPNSQPLDNVDTPRGAVSPIKE